MTGKLCRQMRVSTFSGSVKPGIENKLGQLIYREPLHARGKPQYLAGQRFSEKGDPHAASDHPIAHAALDGSQVSIAVALTS